MLERTAHAVAPQQLAMSLSTMFAGIALFLSMLGLYSVLVGVVARRTREIGIRLALGDTVRGVFRLVLAEGAVLIGIGLMLGVAGAALAAHSLKGLLFGVRPTDPVALRGRSPSLPAPSRSSRASSRHGARRGSTRLKS